MLSDVLETNDSAGLSRLCRETAVAASMVGAEGVAQVARLLGSCNREDDVSEAQLTQLRNEVRLVSRVAQPKKKSLRHIAPGSIFGLRIP